MLHAKAQLNPIANATPTTDRLLTGLSLKTSLYYVLHDIMTVHSIRARA